MKLLLFAFRLKVASTNLLYNKAFEGWLTRFRNNNGIRFQRAKETPLS